MVQYPNILNIHLVLSRIFLILLHVPVVLLPYCLTEVCTAPKNRGGGGAEADVNYNSVAERPHRLKPFQAAARPLRASFLMGRGAGAPPGDRPAAALWYLEKFFLVFFSRFIALLLLNFQIDRLNITLISIEHGLRFR
jgi:hypothetical protein